MNKEVKGVEKMSKEVKGVEKMSKEVKGVEKMSKEVKGVEKMKENKEVKGVEKMKENKEVKGVEKMTENKEIKELIEKIETQKMLLVEKVLQWASNLHPVKNIHVKIKGRYYPLLDKNGKLSVIDKVEGKKIPFDTLDKNMKFVISAILAERKEEIEKEVKEDKKKYLEEKAAEIDKLLNLF